MTLFGLEETALYSDMDIPIFTFKVNDVKLKKKKD